jgi:hypothetical protein
MDIQAITARIQEITGWIPVERVENATDFTIKRSDYYGTWQYNIHCPIGHFHCNSEYGTTFNYRAALTAADFTQARADLEQAERVLDYLNSL